MGLTIILYNLKSTLHLRDGVSRLVETNASTYALTSQLHLRDTFARYVEDSPADEKAGHCIV